MLLIRDKVEDEKDLFMWMYRNKPTAQEVMDMWVRGYLIAHKEEIESKDPPMIR